MHVTLTRHSPGAGLVVALPMTVFSPTRTDHPCPRFAVTLDNHSGDISIGLAKSATLTVDGIVWTVARWNGDGPSGHHRSGSLGFAAGGPARGTARLEITGSTESVDASWRRSGA